MAVSGPSVVVGVDGSPPSRQAAAWAALEARRRRAPLHLVQVNDDPARAEHCAKAVADIAAQCRATSPESSVAEEVAPGQPVDELLRFSARAQLIVVGSRGHGGFADALIGSVSMGVAMRAACPVVVVRGDGAAATGPVVVGVDNSPRSEAALDFAFEAANQRATDLVAVQALPDAHFVPGPFPHPDREEIEQLAEQHLTEQLASWVKRYPDVPLRKVVTNELPAAALRDAARAAQLLVVGHRGRGGFAGLLLGSVTREVLHHAPCPTAVVHTREPQDHSRGA